MKLRVTMIAATLVAGAVCGSAAADGDRVPNLYERLGGTPGIQVLVDDFVTRLLADKRVNGWFSHAAGDPERAKAYKAKLTDFICQGTGGPCKYTGADMLSAHRGRGVTEEAFGAVVSDLVASMDQLKVPEKEKNLLLGILGPMKAGIVEPHQN